MIDVSQNIIELSKFLDTCLDEKLLLEYIETQLKVLRAAYSENQNLFTPEDVSFLKNLSGTICPQLRLFIELKEELPLVSNLDEYATVKKQLSDIKLALEGFAVCRQVNIEIRDLTERRAQILEQDENWRQSKVSRRIIELEEKACRCSKGHLMCIRESKDSYFWGCSQYPLHQETRRLSAEEMRFLTSV